MNILLVDDEPLALQELKDTLLRVMPDSEPRCFTKAREAMTYAEDHPIHIAFLDINMRVMDGITMAEKLMARYPNINIIFCTGYTEYAVDAHNLFCSGYLLKPVTEKKIFDALSHLRFPISDPTPEISIVCFGNFEIYYNGHPIPFKRGKTKELLAYLVDRKGADCSTKEIMAAIFEDEDKRSYFDNLRIDLLNTLEILKQAHIIRHRWGILGINRNSVKCDYFDYLEGKTEAFNGEYLSQYSWAEPTLSWLIENTAP